MRSDLTCLYIFETHSLDTAFGSSAFFLTSIFHWSQAVAMQIFQFVGMKKAMHKQTQIVLKFCNQETMASTAANTTYFAYLVMTFHRNPAENDITFIIRFEFNKKKNGKSSIPQGSDNNLPDYLLIPALSG